MSLPDERQSDLQDNLKARLEDHVAWPVKAFKLEMEKYNVYQDETGTAIDQLDNIEREEIDNNTYYFESGTSESEIRDSDIYNKTQKFREFLNTSGNMANLAGYIAVCKVYSELSDYLPRMEVHPENNFNILPHTRKTPDLMVAFPGEYNPVEIYNGADYLNERTKDEQLRGLSSDDNDPVKSNPILINRRSEGDYKDDILEEENLLIIDTDIIFAEEEIYSDYETCLEYLNVDSFVHTLPKLKAANGDYLSGDDYDIETNGPQGYDQQERLDALQPPEEMTDCVEELPNEYLKRIRGGLQLQYVYTLYRRAENSTSQRRAGALVMQETYNNILRADRAVDMQTAFEEGWEDAKDQYDWLSQMDKSNIRQEFEDLVDELEDERIVTTPGDDKLSPRQATHPQPTFSIR